MPVAPPLFEKFDRIRIINLLHRTDRRSEMEHQLSCVGLNNDARVEFFPAIACNDPGPFRRVGEHGVFQSHMALLRSAAEAGQSILILEDDCDFLQPAIAEYRLPERWDIFYGGYEASNPGNLHDSDIIGAHFMGFSQSGARAAADYLMQLLETDFPPDTRAAAQADFDPALRPPVDGAYVWMRRAQPQLVTEFAMLGTQRRSRTDIGEQPLFDRIALLRNLANWARRRLENRRSRA